MLNDYSEIKIVNNIAENASLILQIYTMYQERKNNYYLKWNA